MCVVNLFLSVHVMNSREQTFFNLNIYHHRQDKAALTDSLAINCACSRNAKC